MSEPSRSLGARVAALETQVNQLSQQVRRGAGVLAGGADWDVDQIRGEIRDFRHDRVDTGFTEIRGTLDATAAGQRQIVELLTTLIGDRPEDTTTDL